MIVHGDQREIEAIGQYGVVIVELELERVRMAPRVPDPAGIRLYILEPGQRVSLENLAAATAERSMVASALLEEALDDMARDYRDALGSDAALFDTPRWLQTLQTSGAIH
jgi:hypothetical protein